MSEIVVMLAIALVVGLPLVALGVYMLKNRGQSP
jgi:hypothetical protein